jgi:hypothetical protein
LERERLESERLERERLEQERLEQERLEHEHHDPDMFIPDQSLMMDDSEEQPPITTTATATPEQQPPHTTPQIFYPSHPDQETLIRQQRRHIANLQERYQLLCEQEMHTIARLQQIQHERFYVHFQLFGVSAGLPSPLPFCVEK